MATYFQSLAANSVSDQNHIVTVSGTYTTSGDVGAVGGPYNLIVEEVAPSGQVINSTSNLLTSSVNSDGTFSVSYNGTNFPIPQGYSLEIGTTDTANGSTISTSPYYATQAIDGYLAGAKIYVDTNSNGVLDSGEYSTTTDASGNAFLPAGSGQIVAVGGTDTSTGLAFTGTLTATSGASVVTPITTLVNQVAQLNGGNVAAAQASVASALGLSGSLNLNSLDPFAATSAGTAGASNALASSEALINTAKLISATGASGNAFAAIASQIVNGGGTVDLTNASTITAIATAAGASSAAASAVGQVAAASNTALVQAVTTNAGSPSSLLQAVSAISTVAQGTTATAVAAAGNDTTKLAQVVVTNTGSALTTEISGVTTTTSSTGVVTGGATNNVASDATQSLQNFLTSVFDNVGSVPVTYIGGTGSATTTANLDNSVGVVTPGSNAYIHASTDAALLISGGSNVDLSGSPLLNTAGQHLGISVQIGDGNNTLTLNKGPSSALSSTGNDTIISSGGHDTLVGGFGHDSLVGGGYSQLFGGSVGGDTLVGGLSASSHDTLIAGIGGDLITTASGHNLIYGNENDTIRAGVAHDTIVAGYGSETIHGGLGSTIYGGGLSVMSAGNHDVYNVTGADTIYGSNHTNTVNIGDGSDGVVVDAARGTGSLTVNVNASTQGNDTLFGGTNADGTGSNLTITCPRASQNNRMSIRMDIMSFIWRVARHCMCPTLRSTLMARRHRSDLLLNLHDAMYSR